MKILLLEDDPLLGESIEEILEESGYYVTWVRYGNDVIDLTFNNRYNLYLFDINVPDWNGLDLTKQLRFANDTTPTIFISVQADIASISKGFAIGAQDYIKKPFHPEELLIRINAKFSPTYPYSFEKINYDPNTKEIYNDQLLLQLGDVQQALLICFISNVGRTLDKETLYECMEHPSENSLRVAINKLKHITGWNIQSVRGIGYRLDKS